MNEVKKLNINCVASTYLATRSDDDFSDLYRSLLAEYKSKLAYWTASTFMADDHDVTELFTEALLKSLESVDKKGGDFVKLFNFSLHNKYKSLLRKLRTRRKYEQYELNSDDDSETAIFEIKDEFNLENHVIKKKEADQRQLIDFLVRGENERTTAIVQAFLNHPKPNATAIAKEIGLDHKQVSRALSRLAANFSTKQFGNYEDYLVAL